ncbi:MAG: hypothetical protein LUH07_13325, partial [Lachnospiraceae bacterium]|nr:hypothetical protein [Lachnospiraceae bacterium]
MTEKRRRRRKQRSEFAFVLKLLITVILVILVFEGRLIYIMFTYDSSGTDSDSYVSSDSELESEKNDTETSEIVISDDMYLAGIADAGVSGGMDTDMEGSEKTGTEEEAEAQTAHDTVSDPDSTAIVWEQDTAVDDSYFSDAVFIGDSRMEGFRNASGITEGTFFTSVGMSLSSMTSKEIISSRNDKV